MRKVLILLTICVAFTAAGPVAEFMNKLLGVTGNTQTVLASCFTDQTGMRDNNLYNGYNYAELSVDYKSKDFKALGNLPYGYQLRITYNGKSIIAKKGDVGAGGPNHPKLDIHVVAAKALGITNCDNFLSNVVIEYIGN